MTYDVRVFSAIAFAGTLLLVIVEAATDVAGSRKVLLAGLGLFLGLLFAQLFYPVFSYLLDRTGLFRSDVVDERLVNPETARFICDMMFGYFGIVLALRHSDWLRPGNLKFFFVNPIVRPKILDSSVIIDGRIVEVIRLGLIGGPIVVPNFVLLEIQSIADSADPYRRAKGRRGLAELDRLQEHCKSLDIVAKDYPTEQDVDQKLTHLCREMNAELVTNDYNLQKIASLHQIHVININELADVLKPAVYVGETLDLMITKAGKEAGQGVGYLQDGTMVVVENAQDWIGQECGVVVTNILQNPSGRLTFARLIEASQERVAATAPRAGAEVASRPAAG